MSYMHYIGIDPGLSGGLAMLATSGEIVDATKMPATERDIHEWLRDRLTWFGNAEARAHAVLERVSAFPKMGVVSAFTFGKGFGVLIGVLTGLEVPFDLVAPPKWQAMLQCRTLGDKNVSKRRAQQLFPKFSVTHATADALLLAEYGRRMQLGMFHTASASRGSNEKEKAHTDQREGRKVEGPISSRRSSGQARDERQRPAAQGAEAAPAGHSRHGARAAHRPGRVL